MPHGAGLQGPGLSLDEQLMYGRSDQSATFENDPLLPDGPRAFNTHVPVCSNAHARKTSRTRDSFACVGVCG